VMVQAIRNGGLSLDGILLTHGHFDHMMNLASLLAVFPVPVYLGIGDKDFPSDGRKNAFSVFFGQDRTFPEATDLLHDDDTLMLGADTLRVIATPGHSGGSVCFYDKSSRILLTGDTLFSDNVGRTDLYGGSWEILRDSLECLAELAESDPDVTIYPGHGMCDTLKNAIRAVM